MGREGQWGEGGGEEWNEHRDCEIQPTSTLGHWMISEGDVLFGGRSWYHLS